MSHDPSVLRNDKRYVIVFGNGQIEDHIMPYDFHAVIHHIDSFVNSLRERNFLDAREVRIFFFNSELTTLTSPYTLTRNTTRITG